MIRTYTHEGATWVDLDSPTESEVNQASEIAGIDPSLADDLLSPTSRRKIEFGDAHAYLVIHFPSLSTSRNDDAAFEVDFLITKKAVITTHYGKVEIFENLKPEDTSELGLFFSILSALLKALEDRLSEVDHRVRNIEKKMFSAPEKTAVFALSEASRHLTDFKKITAVYPDTLSSLEQGGEKLFGKKFAAETHKLSERCEKLTAKLNVVTEWTSELRETVSTLVNIRQNETMLALTIFTILSDIFIGGALIYLALHGH